MGEGKVLGYVAKLLVFALLCMTSASSHEPLFEQGAEQSAEQGTLQEAEELMNQVDKLHWEGQYRAAILLAERAVEIRERLLGPEHPDTATSINTLGRNLRFAGDYPRAERLLKRALAIREKVFGPEHPTTAYSLTTLGALYQVANDFSQAELINKQALAIQEKNLGPEDHDTLMSMNNLALLYQTTGDYPSAGPLFRRILAIRERVLGSKHRDTAKSLIDLGHFYRLTERFELAEPLLKRGLAIREEVLGVEHPDTASALRLLGSYYVATGRFNEAEPLYQRSIHTYEKTLGLKHPNTVCALSALAALYVNTGAYEFAEPIFLQVIAIDKEVLGESALETSRALANLGRLYIRMGAYDRAELLLRRVLESRAREFGFNNLNTAFTSFDLAELYVAMGRYSEAESLHQQALAINENVLGSQHSYVANSLQDLANLYIRTGDARAESYLYRALAIHEKSQGSEHPETVSALSTLATFEWSHRKRGLALRLFQRVQMIQANNSERFLLSGSEARKGAYLQTLEEDTYKQVSFSLAVPGSESTALGLTGVLQYKGRVLDSMSDSMSRFRQHARAEDRALLERRSNIANQLSTLTYKLPANLSIDEYRQRLDRLRSQQEKLDVELAERSSEFRQQVAPITVPAVQQAIPGDAALIEWFRYVPIDPKKPYRNARLPNSGDGPRYVAYVLKRDADPVAIDVGDAKTIESLVRDFRSAVSDAKQAKVKERAANLSRALLTPLYSHLGDVEHLLISPDGALNLVPMAALLDDQGEYLANSFAITYLTSGRDLLRFESKSKVGTEDMIVANPNFGNYADRLAQATSITQTQRSGDLDRSGLIFRPLVNTGLEAHDLQSLLKLDASEVLLREEATEAKLKQVHGPRILHIASHGFFLSDQELTVEFKKRSNREVVAPPLSENPLLRSGIAMAGANSRRSGASDDGIFTALEAAQLDLQGTQLVVLSACDSGVGDVQNGEGVYGLRRALVLAGAQTQVTSLWKVSDEATRLLMVDYYQRLLKGEGRSAALRQAQQAMRANPKYSHPYYWASFVPIGNWTPLPALH